MLTLPQADVLARLLAADRPLLPAEFGLPDVEARAALAQFRRDDLVEQHDGGWRVVDRARAAAALAVNGTRQLHALATGLTAREAL